MSGEVHARRHQKTDAPPADKAAPAAPADGKTAPAEGSPAAAKPAEATATGTKAAAPTGKSTPAAAPAPATPAPSAQSAAAPATPAPAPAAAPAALADESAPRKAAARAHFERGVELYLQNDFANAWLEFQSAYQITPLVDLLNNLARCEVRIGRPGQALDHFRSFIAARPDDPDGEYIRQEIARLEADVGRRKTAEKFSAPAEVVSTTPVSAPRRFPIYGTLAGATTVALLLAGAATLGSVNSRYNDLQAICQDRCSPLDVNVLQQQSYAGYGLLGVGGLGAAVTGVLLYLELRSPKEGGLRPLAGLRLSSPTSVYGRF